MEESKAGSVKKEVGYLADFFSYEKLLPSESADFRSFCETPLSRKPRDAVNNPFPEDKGKARVITR